MHLTAKQWEISQLPGPKVLGRTATFLICFISSMYNWDILKIRKLPEFQLELLGVIDLQNPKCIKLIKTKAVMPC